jgi:hypothetical protein
VIRNAVLHLPNEQPLLADLFELPVPSDVGLRCTNLRTLAGKRPIFADDSGSVFVFPFLHVRFVEIPAASAVGTELGDLTPVPAAVAVTAPDATVTPEDDGDLEIDEDFLRRIREV